MPEFLSLRREFITFTYNHPGMKKLLILTIFSCICMYSLSQDTSKQYDSVLAKKLGADDYGMKYYVLVILKTGLNTNTAAIRKAFEGHMENINKMVRDGKLIVAGPLQKNELSYRGIFILDVEDIEEAGKLVQNDPAVRDGFLDAEYLKWYESAALPLYLPYSEKNSRSGF